MQTRARSRRWAAVFACLVCLSTDVAWAQTTGEDSPPAEPDPPATMPSDEQDEAPTTQPTDPPSDEDREEDEPQEGEPQPRDVPEAPSGSAPGDSPMPDADVPEETADDSGKISDEEMQELEAALAADAEGEDGNEGASAAGQETLPTATTTSSTGTGAASGVTYDLAFILDVAGAWFSREDPMQLGAHDPSQTGFNFQQLEVSVGASVDPFFRFDANLVFAPFGVEVEEAFGTTTALPANLQLRAGQFLTPFGRLNPTHPHSWHFLDQPLVNGKFFGGEGSRGLGVELSWLSPLPWYVEVTGAANQADGECCARSFYGGDNPGVRGPADLLYTTRIEQFFPLGDAWSLLWGLSAQFGPNSTGLNNRTEIYGSDLYLRYRPPGMTSRTAVSLQLEGMFRTRQVPQDLLQDHGGYATLSWHITPRWETAVRQGWVAGVEDDPLDPAWTEPRYRTSLQGTFYPSHFSRVRMQLHYDAPTWLEQPGYAAMLGLELLVGAHGSHEF